MLLRPHHYTFNRDWYEEMDGKPMFHSVLRAKFARLTAAKSESCWSYFRALDLLIFQVCLD